MSQNLPVPPADDQHALVTRHIATLALGPQPMDQLADVDAQLLAERADARRAGDQERAQAVQRLIDFLDGEVATIAHAFASHLQELGPQDPAGVQGVMLSVAQVGARARQQQGWGMHITTLSMLRDGLRHQTIQGQPAWDFFTAFARDYRPEVMPDADECQSDAARDLLAAIAGAQDTPTLARLHQDLLGQQDDPMLRIEGQAEDPDIPGLPAPFVLPGADPLPEADEMLLKRALRTRTFTLFNEAYLRGLRVEGADGAAEAIHAVIEPDPLVRMQEPNPVVAQGERIAEMLPEMLAAARDRDLPEGEVEEMIEAPQAPMRPRAGEERLLPPPAAAPVAAPQTPRSVAPAEPALPADEIDLGTVNQHLFQGTALGRTLLKGMGYENVDQQMRAALEEVTQRIARGGPRPSR